MSNKRIMMHMEDLQRFGAFRQILSRGVLRQYPKKRTILFQGEVPRSVMVLQKGIVKVYGITSSGDQRTITLLTAGDVFPMSWVFDKSPVCMYYYEAITDSSVLNIPKSEYQKALEEFPDLKEQVYTTYMSHYIAATMHVYALEHSHAQDKLVYILQYLVARFGIQQDDGKVKIGLRLSHQDIAEMVGITRETTAVELHRLKKKGFIDYQRFTYIIDVEKLIRATGSDEFENVKV